MNLIDVLKEKNLLFLAIGNKIYSLQINTKTIIKEIIYKKNRSLKFLYECEDAINQIKLIRDNNDIWKYIICVDMKGFLYKIDIDSYNCQKFDCKNEGNTDNSCWSLDANYPYVATGGNHYKIKIHNVENSSEINNWTISYNKNNVPCVSFSPCLNFILSTSIDKHVI